MESPGVLFHTVTVSHQTALLRALLALLVNMPCFVNLQSGNDTTKLPNVKSPELRYLTA